MLFTKEEAKQIHVINRKTNKKCWKKKKPWQLLTFEEKGGLQTEWNIFNVPQTVRLGQLKFLKGFWRQIWSCHDVGVDRIRLLEPLLQVKTILQAKLGAGCHIQVIKAEQGAKKSVWMRRCDRTHYLANLTLAFCATFISSYAQKRSISIIQMITEYKSKDSKGYWKTRNVTTRLSF